MARSARGQGTIRKKTVKKNGREYTYWEGRYTSGYDPGTGRQIQRSISGRTQQEVAKKLKAATAAIDSGTYTEPSKLTVGQWLNIWVETYLTSTKPHTRVSYTAKIRNYLVPAFGATRLESLTAPMIQNLYNSLLSGSDGKKPLSAKSVHDVHGVLHAALRQAVRLGYIRYNPCESCILPRVVRHEIKPLNEIETKAFLEAVAGDRFETLYIITLFTGLRLGEVMGLLWDNIDFDGGTITVRQQLQREKQQGGKYVLTTLKNGKTRILSPAPWVMQMLRTHRTRQLEQRLRAGELWTDTGLVFTDEIGQHYAIDTIRKHFKRIAAKIGRPDLRFHDLRHSYAVAALRGGDDVKTVQQHLGHATAAFTLDVYGHVTEEMQKASAARMENYIQTIIN